MSVKVNLDDLSDETRQMIADDLEFKTKPSYYAKISGNDDGKTIYAFDIRDNYIYLPFYYATNTLELTKRDRKDFRPMSIKFQGKLRPLQKEIKTEAIKLLNRQNCCVIALYTGGGKTATAINISVVIKLPTLIIVTRILLMDQWESSILKFCPGAKIQKITTKKKILPDMDFYIINAINVHKFKGNFSHIGTLIADEMHLLGTEKLSESFLYINPKYVIGLSATPSRPDGLDDLLASYFGTKQLYRQLFRAHTVYKVETKNYMKVDLEIKTTNMGVLDWNAILNSQANCEKRNLLITRIVSFFPDRNFLILCKRVAHGKMIEKMLKEEGVDVTSLIGVKRSFDTNARVLVATVQKAGVGFDHPKLNGLIIAADVEQYFIQYLGRVFRTEDGEPVIFDIVDDFPTLKRHFTTRSGVYRKHGGTIKKFIREFPNFNITK